MNSISPVTYFKIVYYIWGEQRMIAKVEFGNSPNNFEFKRFLSNRFLELVAQEGEGGGWRVKSKYI